MPTFFIFKLSPPLGDGPGASAGVAEIVDGGEATVSGVGSAAGGVVEPLFSGGGAGGVIAFGGGGADLGAATGAFVGDGIGEFAVTE